MTRIRVLTKVLLLTLAFLFLIMQWNTVKKFNKFFESERFNVGNEVQLKSTARKNPSRAIIHVGTHKTASTSIQKMSRLFLKELMLDNYQMPWMYIQPMVPTSMRYFARCFLPETHKQKEFCDKRLIQHGSKISKIQKNILISAEFFSHEHIDIHALKEYLREWEDEIIVVYYRRFYDWFQSYYHHEAKYMGVSFFRPLVENFDTFLDELGGRYVTEVVRRYRKYYSNIVILNFHDTDVNVGENFFCNAIPNANNVCNKVKGSEIPTSNQQTNSRYKEIGHHAYKKGLLKFEEEDEEKVLEQIQKFHEEKLQGSMEHIELECIPDNKLEILLEKSLATEKELFPQFFASPHGEAALRADFEEKKKSELCSVNFEAILNQTEWQEFFNTFYAEK